MSRVNKNSVVRYMDSRLFALFGLVSPDANAILLQTRHPADSEGRDPFNKSDSRKYITDTYRYQ
jgi:hypothetical protein